MSEAERTIPAGERRIERMRATHGVPVRGTPIAIGALVGGALGVWAADVAGALGAAVRDALAQAGRAGPVDPALGAESVRALALGVAATAWPAMVGGVLGAALGALVQTGGRLRAPGTGARVRLAAPAAAAAGAFVRVGWAAVLAGAASAALVADWPRLAALPGLPLEDALRAAAGVATDAVAAALVAGCALAVVDVAWARWRWTQAMQMTPEEAREERRAAEGDPEVRGRRRAAARRMRVVPGNGNREVRRGRAA
jgi:flagellar biosynthesis protein FlhB